MLLGAAADVINAKVCSITSVRSMPASIRASAGLAEIEKILQTPLHAADLALDHGQVFGRCAAACSASSRFVCPAV